MAGMNDYKYFTKKDLIEANDAAVREKRHKKLTKEFVNNLPEELLYIVFCSFFHTKDEVRLSRTR